MTDFTKQYSGFRYAKTRRGDSMQLIAYRELGDANEWAKLVWFNNLVPPFITDDETKAGDRVILSGNPIRIPTTVAESAADGSTEEANVLLVDCKLPNGRLAADSETGDFAIVSGRENLKQAIKHRILTDPGELMYHPTYGCKIGRRKGMKNAAVTRQLGQMDVQNALLDENRLRRIEKITTTSNGDVLSVAAVVTPISGDTVQADASV